MRKLVLVILAAAAPSLAAQSAPGAPQSVPGAEFARRHGCSKVGTADRPMVGMTACEAVAAAGVPTEAYELELADHTTTALLVYWKNNVRFVVSLFRPATEHADLAVTGAWWPACFADSLRSHGPGTCPPGTKP